MNLCRCENGHFYDKEKYATCPHCAAGVQTAEDVTQAFVTEELDGVGATEPLDPSDFNTGGFNNNDTGMGNIQPQNVNVTQNGSQQFMRDASETVATGNNAFSGGVATGVEIQTAPVMNNVAADDEDDDHTIGIYDYQELFTPETSSATAKTTAASNVQMPSTPQTVTTPCTGWLIAINGNHLGQDFHLKVGKNFIGRDSKMDVALVGDKSVSRNKHAIVVYEPKQHLYLVQPGESSELVYLNDEVVLSPMKLKAYDKITIGEVNLIFMPLCGEQFNWTDILKHRS